MARAPAPIFRGQGNAEFRSERRTQTLKRGQTVPYDVNGAGTGSIPADNSVSTTKLQDNAATNAKLADMAEATFKMRAAGAGSGDPIDGTPAQAKTALAITAADVSGLGYFATGTDAANLTGTVAAARLPQFTGGNVTSPSAGSVVLNVTPAAAQADSTAADVAALKADLNALLAKLRTAGLLAT